MKIKKKQRLGNQKKGFTLIEMIVVVFVVSVGLIGAMSFFNVNLNSQFEAKNELIAAGLAQEGLDLVRNIVDHNKLNGIAWYNNLCSDDCSQDSPSNLCRAIDYTSLSDQNCENKTKICFSGSRYYECPNMGNTDQTIFGRDIDILGQDINNDSLINLGSEDCMNVSVTVLWNGRSTVAKDIICGPRD